MWSRWWLARVLFLVGCSSCGRRPDGAATVQAASVEVGPVSAYGATLRPPEGASASLKDSVADAVDALAKVTGAPFASKPLGPADGVILVRAGAKDAPAEDVARLKDKGPEAFVIRSQDTAKLWIVANSDAGLVNGLYYYLREIGCRWFFPGDAWTILPRRRDVTLHIDRVVVPAFRMRSFAGTGGFGGATPVDPKRLMSVRWDAWKRRNGFGGEFLLGGHTGEAFNATHKAVLQAHPEYLALVNGKRQPWGPTTKLCVSNPEVAALYTEDRLAIFRHQVATDPQAPQSFAISVDPADGGGFCECDRCRAIGSGSPSDQVFFLANQVAKAVTKEMPGRRVSLYAYFEHATVPTIPLEPNVYVSVIPEAFQRTGLSANDFIEVWRKKIPKLSLYTYWSIPDWNNDLPTFDYTTTPREKIRYWHDHGIEGVNLETTFSSGAMGVGFYVASRLLWDPSEDDRALIQEFYALAFGPALPPMKRMLERWASSFTLSAYEVGLSLKDLSEARKAAGSDAAILARITDYDQYVDYIRLWLEYQQAKPKSPERIDRARDVMTDVYRMYDSTMVDSNRMQQLISYRYEKESPLQAEFDPKNPAAAGWAAVTKRGAAAPGELARRYPVPDVLPRRYSAQLVPFAPNLRLIEAQPARAAAATPLLFGGPTDFEIEVPGGVRSFELSVNVWKTAGAPGDTVTVRGPGADAPFRSNVPADGEEHVLTVPSPMPGRYVAHVEDQKTMFFFKPPGGLPAVFRTFSSPWPCPPVYFFVPRGLPRVALFAPGAVPIEIRDSDGRVVPQQGDRVLIVDVPAGQDGKVWSLKGYKSWEPIRMLNLPQVFALSPDALLEPVDAAH